MIWPWVLGVWTVTGVVWRVVGLWLVAARDDCAADGGSHDARLMTVFKALPGPLHADERERLRQCLESCVVDLDRECQLLIGCHAADREFFASWIEGIAALEPQGVVTLVSDDAPTRLAANPKISWYRILAPFATGSLWLWSDADIVSPPGWIASLRADITARDVGLVTSPYVIRDGRGAAGLLDQLFVNAEFYPGVLLTGRLGLVRFAFGSGMLFDASRFAERIDWEALGRLLADDHELGRRLGPTRLGSLTVTTHPAAMGWGGALLHYLRWHKTVRWVQPASYAAQLSVVPVVGWFAWVLLQPSSGIAWLGLAALLLLESGAAILSCRLVGSTVSVRHWPLVPLWALVRGLISVACWLPWPISWRGQWWCSPRKRVPVDGTLTAPRSRGAE